ncbi:MAG TPA: cytochrome c [Bryobacteraceae bacterium]
MTRVILAILGTLVAVGIGAYVFLRTAAGGLSAMAEPSALEKAVARAARQMAIPPSAKSAQNPTPNTGQVLADARAHWADHCASCHANDGSGNTQAGKHMYPPAPDMRQPATQNLSDGELFYVIQNGVRLTGMPGWATGAHHDEEDSWKLVRFIRHLPQLTAVEEREMEALNPKSPDELKEEQEEKEFLNGDQSHEHTEHHHH